MSETGPISVASAYSGRHVLITGGSGFLGKVWLSMVLHELPDVGRVYVFLRPKALVSARRRFERMLNDSPAFKPLHDRFGCRLGEYLTERVEVLEGELDQPNLGLDSNVCHRLFRQLDLVIHCAGLVDFNPDLGKALASNVDATMRVADFVERCDHASLLHVSTSYVAGSRPGRVPETLRPDYAPNGQPYSVERELQEARLEVERIRRAQDEPQVDAELRARVEDEARDRGGFSEQGKRNLLRRYRRERLKAELSEAGMTRAAARGFPNTYTYTKSMAESLLYEREERLRFSIFRPTIVESALHYPFPGWNESFNGSAPLAYVMGSWYRMVPAKPDAPFDVIPVDQVCAAMTICGAALIEKRSARVYQIGTSDRNCCSVGRAAELIVLAHRQHFRARGRSKKERIVKSRWDATLVSPDHPFGVNGLRSALNGTRHVIDVLPDKLRAKMSRLEARVDEIDGELSDIELMVELYMPFMYENFHVFECREIEAHPSVEPFFQFAPDQIDWRRYWLDVHMPGLRRWAFPLIEGRRPERYRAPDRTTLPPPPTDEAEALVSLPAPARVPR
ncbi:MAG: SDR family oxidoreductase [Myxococcales bacterium]|nr:SDR family oxidoreductase [Myxococcales bacterium]